ncbi:MAG: tetratricopeptide repeat protein [Betaproteobacteria bacterium]
MSELDTLLADAAAHASAGRVDAALAAYRSALSISPALGEVHYNVGALFYAKGDTPHAERSFAMAMQHRPRWLAAPLAMGHLLFEAGRFDDARRAFERAVSIDGQSVEALGNLGLTLQRRGNAGAAQPYLERARALAPSDTHAWFALRGNLLALGRLDDAIEDFQRFEADATLSAELVVTGLAFARAIADPSYESKYLTLALDWPYRADQVELLAVVLSRLQYHDVARETIARLYRAYDGLQQQTLRPVPPSPPQRGARDPGRRLRVGYLSADFRAHVMGRLLLDVLSAHDRSRVSLHLYSLSPAARDDALTARFRALADSFTALADMDDPAAARAIATDGVDVLVDLMGHTAGSRPGILLRKPAPLIATHLGYHGCIGLSQVDFKITDAYADAGDAAQYQIESPLVLDACVMPVRRVAPSGATALGRAGELAAFDIADDAVLFAAFVSWIKLSPRCLALWREILARVPSAKLVFSPIDASEAPRYFRRLQSFGIGAERVVVLPAPTDDAHARARYRMIDAVLDTLPYTGGDTTAAALDMGVPVITRVGERHAERVTYSLLAHLGVTATVARSDDEYVALACRIAQDAAWRAGIAASIVERLPASGLADPARHARALESAYRRALAARIAAAA